MRPSRGLAALILGAHVAAAVCAFAVLPDPRGAVLAILVAALGVAAARDRALLRGRGAPRVLELREAGRSFLLTADGRRLPVASAGGRASRHWATVAVAGGSRRRLLLTEGMLDDEAFRWLRLWILWGRLPKRSGRGSGPGWRQR